MAAHCANSSTKSMWRSLQTIEMPCSTCEWTACLNQIQQNQGCTEYAAIKFVMERIPGDPEAMIRMRSRLIGRVWQDVDVYTGLDVARCSAVFNRYLSKQPVLDGNAWQQWIGKREAFIKSLQAPVLYCIYCGDPLRTTRGGGNSLLTMCPQGTVCATTRKQQEEAAAWSA